MKDRKRIVQEALVEQGISTSRIGFNYLTEAILYQYRKGDERFLLLKTSTPIWLISSKLYLLALWKEQLEVQSFLHLITIMLTMKWHMGFQMEKST